ncbi:MAG TPA: DNA phosphorothioation-associated putative methyltransferase [candidate division Zixibacteria bacterium]|nr:DNA phosphorothioation-associated putative methyltransferase [candidate division Zixibacteria bacterium]
MEFKEYKELVKQIPAGKQLPDAVYIHETAIDVLPRQLGAHFARAVIDLELENEDWNIIKFFKRDHKFALLDYPEFFEDAYPSLRTSYTIDLEKNNFRKADYTKSDNPPILHRKETFLKPDHPDVPSFKAFTEEGEKIGLYENTKNIGFKKSWERLISRKGYLLDQDGHLQPKCSIQNGSDTSPELADVSIERHLTAIDRNKLSAPMQILARHNYFDGNYSVLDYGCGKGDDVRELEAHGLNINAWDPVHRQDGNKECSDIVNLGYVINVIEERKERDGVLKEAYTHSNKLLIVSVMLGGDAITSQFTPYKDGVITQRNTFQKYYSQSGFRSYIETTLAENAIAVGPCIFIVFKDKDEEQLFLSERQKIRRDWQHITQRERKATTTIPTAELIDKHKQLFNDFWQTCLDLGRIPANDEFEFTGEIRKIADSHKKAFEALTEAYDEGNFESAHQQRKGDLLVYFALGLFDRRKPYSHMPESLKRDLKVFFKTYLEALEQAKELLFSVGSPENIEIACNNAYKKLNSGHLDKEHSYTLHSSLINQLPPTLRVYIGCATQLYGDIEGIDLVKIHMTSGKVTLLRYDDWNKDTPMLIERIKIKMREQDIDFFDYTGEYKPQPLYLKSQYI